MYRLDYVVGNRVVNSYYLPNLPLARWKKKTLKSNGNHSYGTFVITRV
jgi:hypothetical protein